MQIKKAIILMIVIKIIMNQNCNDIENLTQKYICQIDKFPDSFFVKAFNFFKDMFSKTYRNSTEENKRYAIFKANYKKILVHNLSKSSFKQEVNKFTDLTETEFESQFLSNFTEETTNENEDTNLNTNSNLTFNNGTTQNNMNNPVQENKTQNYNYNYNYNNPDVSKTTSVSTNTFLPENKQNSHSSTFSETSQIDNAAFQPQKSSTPLANPTVPVNQTPLSTINKNTSFQPITQIPPSPQITQYSSSAAINIPAFTQPVTETPPISQISQYSSNVSILPSSSVATPLPTSPQIFQSPEIKQKNNIIENIINTPTNKIEVKKDLTTERVNANLQIPSINTNQTLTSPEVKKPLDIKSTTKEEIKTVNEKQDFYYRYNFDKKEIEKVYFS